MWGLEHSTPPRQVTSEGNWAPQEAKPEVTVKARIARYSYGVAVSPPFESGKHSPTDRRFDAASNSWKADNQVYWLIKKVLFI